MNVVQELQKGVMVLRLCALGPGSNDLFNLFNTKMCLIGLAWQSGIKGIVLHVQAHCPGTPGKLKQMLKVSEKFLNSAIAKGNRGAEGAAEPPEVKYMIF